MILLFFHQPAVHRHGDHLPRNEFSALLERRFRRVLQSAAAGHLHPHNSDAPYFDGARLLIAADCTAYAYAAFHERFIKGHITLVGCPKLDGVDYSEKLTEIIRENDIKSVTVVRM